MRDYKEVSSNVLRRRDEQLAKDRRRMMLWKRNGAVALTFCFAGAIGLGLHNHTISRHQHDNEPDQNIIVSDTSVTSDTHTDIPNVTTAADTQTSVHNRTTVKSTETTASSKKAVTTTVTAQTTASSKKAETTTAAKSTSSATEANNAVNTTTTAVTSALASGSQTNVTSAAVTTSVTLSQSEPTATTIVTDINTNNKNERSVQIMKRFAAFAAAALTASTVTPYVPHAAEELNVKNIPHNTYDLALEYEKQTQEAISERNLDFDFNSDGKFDNFDCYLFYRRINSDDTLPEDIVEKINKNADIDGDGTLFPTDDTNLICHYLYYCDIDLSILSNETYRAYDKEHGLDSESNYDYADIFTSYLNDRTVFMGINYLFVEKMLDEGLLDPDINADGKFDIGDVLDFDIVTTGDPWVSQQDPDTGYWSYVWSPDKRINLDYEIDKRARAFHPLIMNNSSYYNDYDPSSLLDYLLKTEPLLPEYSDDLYYEKFHEGAQYYEFSNYINCYRIYMGLDENPLPSVRDMDEEFNKQMALEQKFIEDISEGTLSSPDLNFDGYIDASDYKLADLFHGDRLFGRTAEESKLTAEEYENLDKNCDFNNNGISGDDSDLDMIRSFVRNEIRTRSIAKATDETGEIDRGYAEALYMKEMYPDERYDICYQYGLYDADADNYYEFRTQEDFYDSFMSRLAAGMTSPPDIDGNGVVDGLDGQYAASYFNYLDTGVMGDKEIPEDVLERIKTECDFTFDGQSGLMYDMLVAMLYVDRVVQPEYDSEGNAITNDTSTKYNTELKTVRSGDANCDDELSMADAVLIMQSYVNPDKYQITEEGQFNADIADTGDGVTPKDALAIQSRMLGIS